MSRERKHRRGRERGLALGVLDPETAQALTRQRVDSRDWWTFITAGQRSAYLLADLEARHFSGTRNRHFELVLVPVLHQRLDVIGVAFASKRLLTRQQLGGFFDAHNMLRVAEQLASGEKDVFCLGDDEREAVTIGLVVDRLLYGELADRPEVI
jgi:hypothetical protein